ncbi:unnamed protein product, partial [Brenthis ino]
MDNDERGFDLNEEDMHKVLRDKIRLELEFINKVTGLRFLEIPQPPEDDKSRWVFFINRKGLQGCVDLAFNNFTTEGVQRVVLGYDCLSDGNLAGIVLAIVGVPPQHNAPNRDEHIKLHKENILPDKLYLFEILKDDEWLFHDMQYDTHSAGHYLPHQYTSNGAATITMLESKRLTPGFQINSGKKLSSIDIKKIKSLYNYISRQRESPKQVPGCEKLFQPGSNISNFEVAPPKIKPLKKPSKYLGVENTNDQSEKKETEENEKASKSDIDIASNKGNAYQEENESVAEENLPKEEKTSKEDDKNDKVQNTAQNNSNIKEDTDNIKGEKENKDNMDKNALNNVMNDDYESPVISREKYTLTHLVDKKASILDRSDYQTGDEQG